MMGDNIEHVITYWVLWQKFRSTALVGFEVVSRWTPFLLNATFRSLGVLAGPVVGSALLLGLGAERGIFANVLFYLPMTLLMLRTPYTGHTRSGYVHRVRLTLLDGFRVLRSVGDDPVLVSMIVLAGLVAVCVGGSLQVSIPSFADSLGGGADGLGYGLLLFANGAGGVLGGFLLEATGVIKPNTRAVVVATVLFGATTLTVALTGSYVVAVLALLVGGVANMTSTSIGQAVVQLRAPVEQRGRVVGVYNMSAAACAPATGSRSRCWAPPWASGAPSRSAGSCWWWVRSPSLW